MTPEQTPETPRNHPEYQYLDLASEIRTSDSLRMDRTGTGTQGVFGRQFHFDLSQGFPLLTTKKVALRLIIEELLWILAGDTNNNTLREKNVGIWNEWAVEDKTPLTLTERFQLFLQRDGQQAFDEAQLATALESSDEDRHALLDRKDIPRYVVGPLDGALGPVYGAQWRRWKDTRVVPVQDADQWVERGYVYYSYTKFTAPDGVKVVVEKEIDQIAELMEGLRTKPFSRRHVISAWNVADLADEGMTPQANARAGKMALSPCHCLFQFNVQYRSLEEVLRELTPEQHQRLVDFHYTLRAESGIGGPEGLKTPKQQIAWRDATFLFLEKQGIKTKRLNCLLYQRSADIALGVPFNIASYALLTMMVAQCAGMVSGVFIHTFGDAHIYTNHFEGMDEQIQRTPLPLPRMWINPEVKDIFAFKLEDFRLEDYQSHGKISFDVST